MSDFSIRLATATDCEPISSCIASAFEEFRQLYTAAAFADTVPTKEQVAERMRHMSIYVATGSNEVVVGTVACTFCGSRAHLRGMAVRPKCQGADIAVRLLLMVEQDALHAGCSKITLGTTMVLQRAVHFYQRHGFTPTGAVSDFFGMSLHAYEKTLGREQMRPR